MATVSEQLISDVRREVSARKTVLPTPEIKARALATPTPRDAQKALLQPGCSVIAEIQPDTWVDGQRLNRGIAVSDLAQELNAGGAQLIACHLQRRQLEESQQNLQEIRKTVTTPIIGRDIIVDPYQIYESRLYGADAIPLHVFLLEQEQLTSLIECSEKMGMMALVEVRNPAEASRALSAGARTIGVNTGNPLAYEYAQRNFNSISMGLPAEVITVAMAETRTPQELLSYAAGGADAVVIGDGLGSTCGPRNFTRRMVIAGQHPSCPSRS